MHVFRYSVPNKGLNPLRRESGHPIARGTVIRTRRFKQYGGFFMPKRLEILHPLDEKRIRSV